MNNLSSLEGEAILLRNFEEFLMERETLLIKREKIVFEREKLFKERELKCNKLEDNILNKREKLVSDREELAQEREQKIYCREAILYEKDIKLFQYLGFRKELQSDSISRISIRDALGNDEGVELTEKDFNILGLDLTDPYDEQDIKYIKTLQGSYNEIMENARCYLKLSYASK